MHPTLANHLERLPSRSRPRRRLRDWIVATCVLVVFLGCCVILLGGGGLIIDHRHSGGESDEETGSGGRGGDRRVVGRGGEASNHRGKLEASFPFNGPVDVGMVQRPSSYKKEIGKEEEGEKEDRNHSTAATFQPETATLEELHRRIRLDPVGGSAGSSRCNSGGDGREDDDDDSARSHRRRHHVRLLIGIPSVDNVGGAKRRDLQRESWLQYPDVLNSKGPDHLCLPSSSSLKSSSSSKGSESIRSSVNKFHGSVLVRFLLGRHFQPNPTSPPIGRRTKRKSEDRGGGDATTAGDVDFGAPAVTAITIKPFTYSPYSLYEAQTLKDVLLFDMDEGKPSNPNKQAGGGGHWGLETEVGMSRKALYWYVLALRHFSFDYIMKGDDDAFLRIPVLIRDLHFRVEPAAIRQREIWLNTSITAVALSSSKEVGGGVERQEGSGKTVKGVGAGKGGEVRPYVYWGMVMKWGASTPPHPPSFYSPLIRSQKTFLFVGGMAIIMSRAVVEEALITDLALYRFSGPFRYFSSEPPSPPSAATTVGSSVVTDHQGKQLYHVPVSRQTVSQSVLLRLEASSKALYKGPNMDHEDVMVGRSLYNLAMGIRHQQHPLQTELSNIKTPSSSSSETLSAVPSSPSLYLSLGISVVMDCRFHDVHAGANKRSITDTRSVVVHHVRPDEYMGLMRRFSSKSPTLPLGGGSDDGGDDGGGGGGASPSSSYEVREGTHVSHHVFKLC